MECSIPHTLTISLVFNVLLGLTFGGLYLYLYSGLIDHHDKPPRVDSLSLADVKENGFCFSCDDLGRWVTTNQTLYTDILTTDCGHRLCCTEDVVLRDFLTEASAGIKETNDMSENKTATLKKYFEFWRHRKNAAHLYINDRIPVTKNGAIRWKATDSFGTAFISNLKLVDDYNHLQIMEDGQYYVYLALNVPQNHRPESRNFHVILRIYKRSAGENLLVKKFKNDENRQSSLVSLHGLFQFKKNQKIYIYIHKNGRGLIDKTSMSNYFGIYKVN